MMALSKAAKTTSAVMISPSLTASHRPRGTVCDQASCHVPRSSSVPSTGAPATAPRNPGRRKNRITSGITGPRLNCWKNELIVAAQSAPPLRATQGPRSSELNDDRIHRPTASA
jgi:hypothetical protein